MHVDNVVPGRIVEIEGWVPALFKSRLDSAEACLRVSSENLKSVNLGTNRLHKIMHGKDRTG